MLGESNKTNVWELNPDLSKASFANNLEIVKVWWLHPGKQKITRLFPLCLRERSFSIRIARMQNGPHPLVSLLYLCCRRKWLTEAVLCSLSSGRKEVRIRGSDLVSAVCPHSAYPFHPSVLTTTTVVSIVSLLCLLSFCRILSWFSLHLWRERTRPWVSLAQIKRKILSRWWTYCWKSCWLDRNLCKKSLKPTFFSLSKAVRQPKC